MRLDSILKVTAYRGMDSNSLLRMLDAARGLSASSAPAGERTRIARALERITRELQRRRIKFDF